MAEHLGNLSTDACGITVLADRYQSLLTLELHLSVAFSTAQVSGWCDALCERCQVQLSSQGNSFELHFHFFPGWRGRETLWSCSAQE